MVSNATNNTADLINERKSFFKKSQQDIKSLYASIRSGNLDDIKTSNQIFKKKLGYVPTLFSYPFGEYSKFALILLIKLS